MRRWGPATATLAAPVQASQTSREFAGAPNTCAVALAALSDSDSVTSSLGTAKTPNTNAPAPSSSSVIAVAVPARSHLLAPGAQAA